MSTMVALSSNVNDHYKEEGSMDRKEEVLLVEASHADNNDIQESSSELEELPKIRLMRAFVEAQDPSSKEVDDPTIRRFLRARDFDISQASAMLLKYLKWRRTFVPNGFISASEVPNQIAQNKMFLQGSDKKGRPIAVVLGNRHFQDGLKEFKRFVVYGLDKTCARIPPGQEKFIAIGDLEGWGYSNSDIRGYLGALSILQDCYPERLGKPSSTPNSKFPTELQVPNHTNMASMPFSATFSTPLHGYSQTKTTTSSNSSASYSSMAFWTPSVKSSLGSSKSAIFQNGFSLKSPSFNGVFFKARSLGVYARAATQKTLYDFSVKDIDGKDVPLSKFKGKVLLIVNVASKCGLTSSNYSELSHLYEKYKTQGFEILAFPCNQFGGQEPGSNPEIKQFACTRFKAEFPIFDKVDVNGPSTAPVYQFLKSSAGGFLGDLVKWNFEKFLVDKNGKVVERYPPTTSPFQIERDIQKLVAA